MMIPGTIGLAATQVNLLVNTILATSQGPGSVSWLNYAFRLMQFPIGIFGVSIASATLPRVSRLWVSRDVKGVSETITHSIKSVFAINLPASAGLAFLGYPIIELIFQYGRFQPEDTLATARALAMYAVGLTAYSSVKVLVPACYALGNTRLPVFSSFLSVLLTIALNLMMVKSFGYWGLALGTSIAALFNAAFLVVAVRKLIQRAGGELPLSPIVMGLIQYSGVALAMGILCRSSSELLGELFTAVTRDQQFYLSMGKLGIFFGRFVRISILLLEGGFFVVIASRVFHLKEAQEIVEIFTEKLKNKLRPSST